MSEPEHNGTINHYSCYSCGAEWEDEWDGCCDDECYGCGKVVSPYESTHLHACTNEECVEEADDYPWDDEGTHVPAHAAGVGADP